MSINTVGELRTIINSTNPRSAWGKGVRAYANDLLDELGEIVVYSPEALDNARLLKRALLNGARDWQQYSQGGCALIYSDEIAKRLCNKTELARTDNGRKYPNPHESWLDVQARALYQACTLIIDAFIHGENRYNG